jgi:hypothetical protein
VKIKRFKINKKKILILNRPRTASSISKIHRISLTKRPTKGYVLILAVDLKTDGGERMGGREKELPPPERYSGAAVRHARWREAHRSVRFGTMELHFLNQGYWEEAEMKARPRRGKSQIATSYVCKL